MPKLPPPPVPQRLRELLKGYPEHIERLQEVLNSVVQNSVGLMPFDEAIWALEGRLGTFINEARDELEATEASGDAEMIAKAKEKKLLMFMARSGPGNLEELGQYFDIYRGAF